MPKVLTENGKIVFYTNKKSGWDIIDGEHVGGKTGKFVLGCWVDGFGSQTNQTTFMECKVYDNLEDAKVKIRELYDIDDESTLRIDFTKPDKKRKKK